MSGQTFLLFNHYYAQLLCPASTFRRPFHAEQSWAAQPWTVCEMFHPFWAVWHLIFNLHQFTGHLYIDAACTNRQFCDSTFEKDDFKLSMKYAKFLFIPHNDHIHSQNVDSPTAVIFKERPLLLPSDALPKITTIVTWCVSMCFIFHLCVACIGRLMWSQRLNAERTDNAHGAMQL